MEKREAERGKGKVGVDRNTEKISARQIWKEKGETSGKKELGREIHISKERERETNVKKEKIRILREREKNRTTGKNEGKPNTARENNHETERRIIGRLKSKSKSERKSKRGVKEMRVKGLSVGLVSRRSESQVVRGSQARGWDGVGVIY